MLFVVGLVIVIASVVGGYIGAGGHLHVLFQPFEFVIIFGAAIGGVIGFGSATDTAGNSSSAPAAVTTARASFRLQEAVSRALLLIVVSFRLGGHGQPRAL